MDSIIEVTKLNKINEKKDLISHVQCNNDLLQRRVWVTKNVT